jgi:WD40 repeat protein
VGSAVDPTVREWDSSTWQQVGDPWTGHTDQINAFAVNLAGTLAASASGDRHVRLWQLSNRQTIAIFDHSYRVHCVTFSTDGKHVLSGGDDKKISVWAVPEHGLEEDAPEENISDNVCSVISFPFVFSHRV